MKASFAVKALRDAVSSVVPIVSPRSTKESLKTVRLCVGQSTTVAASDSEVSIVRTVADSKPERHGQVLFYCEKLTAILREVTGDEISIEVNEGIALIKCGSARFKVPTYVAEDFPDAPKFDTQDYFTVSAAHMARIASRCVFIDPKATVPCCTGVTLDAEADKLFGVSMERRCMSVATCDAMRHGDCPEKAAAIIPQKAIKLVESIIEGKSSVDIAFTKNAVLFRTDDSVVSSQQITGKIMDWRKKMADEPPHKIPIVPSAFASALRQSMITTVEETRRVNLFFTPDKLTMKSAGSGAGESEVEIPISFDQTMTVSLLPDLLLTAIRMIDGGSQANFWITNEEDFVRLTSDCGVKFVQAQCETTEAK